MKSYNPLEEVLKDRIPVYVVGDARLSIRFERNDCMFQSKNRRTDLAIEAQELLMETQDKQDTSNQEQKGMPVHKETPVHHETPGVSVENAGTKDIKITRVRVTSRIGERTLGKPMGNYITIEVPGLRNNDQDLYEDTCRELAKELSSLIKIKNDCVILIVGLGNWNVTPDSLGPKVVSKLMVTRHLIEYVPDQVDEGIRPVSAIAPGVLGITGIETGEIIKGIVEKIKPGFLIAIDALAARKMERVNTTIQLADTGISPGSGVGNKRMELSYNTLGIPVYAIGVPTVVDAATMANDTIDLVLDNMINEAGKGTQFYEMMKSIDREDKYRMIQQVISPYVGNLIVTPKEIDEVVETIAKVLANGLNIALHEGIDLKDVNRYIH